MTASDCVEIKNLSMSYGHKKALSNVSYAIQSGVLVGVAGANGSGKTTLLKILAGLIQPYSGSVTIFGNADTWKSKKDVAYHASNPYFHRESSILQEMALYARLHSGYDMEMAKQMYSQFGFTMHERLGQLSKGQCALALFILTLSIDAKLYVLDEPFGGIDINTRMKMKDILLNYSSPDKTFVIATHELTDMESLFDEIVLLKNGSIIVEGTADSLRNQYKKSISDIVRELI